MKIKSFSKAIFILSLASLIAPQRVFASDPIKKLEDDATTITDILKEVEEDSERLSINDNVDLQNPPTILVEGKADNSKTIKDLEDSIFQADISYAASKFLLENAPESVKKIKTSLEEKMANAEVLIKESNEVLASLKTETEDDDLANMKAAFRENQIMLESANMLLTSTPQTIKKVEKKLRDQVESGKELTNAVEELIEEAARKEANKVKPLDRKTIGLYYTSPSEEEILSYWRSYRSNATNKKDFDGIDLIDPASDEIYAIKPNLELENPGLLSRTALNDINHVTNTLRYSLGLPEVGISQDKSHYAQAAAVINSLNGKLSHNPALPTGMSESNKLYMDGYKGASKSNLHMGTTMLRQINSYTKDASKKNWDMVGHRKWLISPFVDEFGYGFYEKYGAAYVFADAWPDTELEVVAYPSNVGLSEFFNESTPFSFSVTEAFDITNVTIKMTNLKNGEVREYKTGKNIFVTNTKYKYGYMDNLSWGLGLTGKHGDQYEVEISGIKLNGLDYPVNYTVNFISLEHADK